MNVMVVHYVHSINIININLGYASLMVVPANAVTPIISNVTHPQQAAPSCVVSSLLRIQQQLLRLWWSIVIVNSTTTEAGCYDCD